MSIAYNMYIPAIPRPLTYRLQIRDVCARFVSMATSCCGTERAPTGGVECPLWVVSGNPRRLEPSLLCPGRESHSALRDDGFGHFRRFIHDRRVGPVGQSSPGGARNPSELWSPDLLRARAMTLDAGTIG